MQLPQQKTGVTSKNSVPFEIPITPKENITVKTIPIDASFLVLTLCCIQVIKNADKIPANTDPTKKPMVLYPKKINEINIPGKMA